MSVGVHSCGTDTGNLFNEGIVKKVMKSALYF
jgi:hypothetical protein